MAMFNKKKIRNKQKKKIKILFHLAACKIRTRDEENAVPVQNNSKRGVPRRNLTNKKRGGGLINAKQEDG
jgi:hypothetical protein